jgi:transposase
MRVSISICSALIITQRALRKSIKAFNDSGVDGLIAKKRPGRTAIFVGSKAEQIAQLIDEPERAQRTFWTAKAFHGYISEQYQVQCSYQLLWFAFSINKALL